MRKDSESSPSASPWSETIAHFMALAESIGSLRAHADHTSQRLSHLEQRQSSQSHEMARLETTVSMVTSARYSQMPPQPTRTEEPPRGPGPPSGTATAKKRRWRLVLTVAEKAASIGPTALTVLWWIATRSAGAWLVAEGYATGAWKGLLGVMF